MKTKWFAMLIAFCLLITLASAQPYSIRANRGLNLRAAPSLNADIAETVFSGVLLRVVGEHNRWLKIDRNGREVWLTDWDDFSRVDINWPTESQQPASQIDGCCFDNEECATKQEWAVGSYGFQGNECPKPAELVVMPANNCCYVNRQCQSDEDRIAGALAFQYDSTCQSAPPAQSSEITLSGSVPKIEGSDHFVRHIVTTLNWMESEAPDWYNYVITGLDLIVEVPVPVPEFYVHDGRIYPCTARAYDRERKASLESCFAWWSLIQSGFFEVDQLETAAALAHEACHIHTHEEGIYFATQEDEEEMCRKFGTGPWVLFISALETSLDPLDPNSSRREITWEREEALSDLRQYCSEGYRADLFCPTLEKLQGG